jgi:hypothetical protein
MTKENKESVEPSSTGSHQEKMGGSFVKEPEKSAEEKQQEKDIRSAQNRLEDKKRQIEELNGKVRELLAGRQESDIPIHDEYWQVLNRLRQVANS